MAGAVGAVGTGGGGSVVMPAVTDGRKFYQHDMKYLMILFDFCITVTRCHFNKKSKLKNKTESLLDFFQ
jgi:hypothetical protein